MPDPDRRASDPARRRATAGAGPEEGAMGLLDTLCEAAFVRRSDGRMQFLPWGAAGRGYLLASEQEHRRLRRETKRLLALGLLGVPLVVGFGIERLGPWPIAAFGLLLALGGLLRIAWLTRGLERSPERITRAEANARIAHALRRLWKGGGAAP
jgi:hypothetical protein